MKQYLVVDATGTYHLLKVEKVEVFANNLASNKAPHNLVYHAFINDDVVATFINPAAVIDQSGPGDYHKIQVASATLGVQPRN